MNIGFYGHSNCAYRSNDSFIDLISTYLGANIVNTGTRQGSEERVLYELKKTKKIDVAIIFHCNPSNLFLPGCDRDIGISNMSQSRSEYMFNKWDGFAEIHHSKFLQKFKSAENFWNSFQTYKEYFYDPDLQVNRFNGALLQIDSYIKFKSIKCIHVVENIPSWFTFSSGMVDYEIMKIIKNNPQESGTFFVNCISKIGNELVANKLIELIHRGS